MVAKNIKPEHSKTRVNKAGQSIRDGNETPEDISVIENWRAAHNKILNDWQATLRWRCKRKPIIFAQRLKRRATIYDKLKRQPDMQLSRMHDIAGCRLIFKDIKQLHRYRDAVHASRMKHIRRKADAEPYPYDYISNPHPDNSGYRGIHDIYQYCALPGRDEDWNDLLVEIQYRTAAQHAWATANEIAGSLTGNQSKFGRGDEKQKEFFRLASEIIARSEEKLTSCYPTLSNQKLVTLFNKLEGNIGLLKRLKTLKAASDKYDLKKNVILIFSEIDQSLEVKSYKTFPTAQAIYFYLEETFGKSRDIVLVRAPSGESLRQAYKNYFSDTKDFTRLIDSGLKQLSRS